MKPERRYNDDRSRALAGNTRSRYREVPGHRNTPATQSHYFSNDPRITLSPIENVQNILLGDIVPRWLGPCLLVRPVVLKKILPSVILVSLERVKLSTKYF